MPPQVLIVFGAFATAIVFAIGIPLVKALIRRMDAESKQPRIPGDVAQRLERMEQALEAVAIEVERISEGQRFTTKLLSEVASQGESNRLSPGKPADRSA